MKNRFLHLLITSMTLHSVSFAADLDPGTPPSTKKSEAKPAANPSSSEDDPSSNEDASRFAKPDENSTQGEDKPTPVATVKSERSKRLDGRLSLGTSIGWGVVKPPKGSWIGLGTSDFGVQYRTSAKSDGILYITGRYAPFAGVWTVDRRDYDTTAHGLYGGAEFHLPQTWLPSTTLKAGVELGYMLVYAKPQDHAKAAGDVKGGKLNFTAGGGLDWSILENKVKVGPFARAHFGGFNIFNIGASARFVF